MTSLAKAVPWDAPASLAHSRNRIARGCGHDLHVSLVAHTAAFLLNELCSRWRLSAIHVVLARVRIGHADAVLRSRVPVTETTTKARIDTRRGILLRLRSHSGVG